MRLDSSSPTDPATSVPAGVAHGARGALRPRGRRLGFAGAALAVALLLGLAGPAAAQEASGKIETGADLLRACRRATTKLSGKTDKELLAHLVDTVSCNSYLQGMADVNAYYVALEGGRVLFCVPTSGIEADEAARVVVEYLEAHPGDLHQPARQQAILGMRSAFPCASSTPRPTPAPTPIRRRAPGAE